MMPTVNHNVTSTTCCGLYMPRRAAAAIDREHARVRPRGGRRPWGSADLNSLIWGPMALVVLIKIATPRPSGHCCNSGIFFKTTTAAV
jgi:hypothetical protein